jgi:S1-C subfamily serine protease
MRHLLKSNLIVSLPLLLSCLATPIRADEVADKGRDIFKKNQHAVVTVEAVMKVSASGRGAAREAKQDLTGVVIDPSGLIVIALSAVDPSDLYRRLSEEYKQDIEVSEVKIMLEDGTEAPAQIVLRDTDLDLAFLRLKTKPTSPMAAVDLSKSSPAQVLDEVVALNRLKRGAGRAYAATVERISAVVQKPRTFYIPETSITETSLGSPAFSLDGNVLGLFVMRAVNAQGAGNVRDSLTAIILPAEDVLKAAAQAPAEAKPDEEKKEVFSDPKPAAKPDAPKDPAK